MAHRSARHNAASKKHSATSESSGPPAGINPASFARYEAKLWHDSPTMQGQTGSAHGHEVNQPSYGHLQYGQDSAVAMGQDVFWNSWMDSNPGPTDDHAGPWAVNNDYELQDPAKFSQRTLRHADSGAAGPHLHGMRHLQSSNGLSAQRLNTSQVSLPVSSGSSDVTDTSINYSDIGQFVPGSFTETAFPTSSVGYAAPAPLSFAALQNYGYAGEPAWQVDGHSALAPPGTYTPAGVSAAENQPYPTEPEHGPEGRSAPFLTGSDESTSHTITGASAGPSFSSVGLNRFANISSPGALDNSTGNAFTPASFSVPSPESRRSSVFHNDNVSIDLNALNIAQDFASPISPGLSTRSAESSRMSRTSSRPYHNPLDPSLSYQVQPPNMDIEGVAALASPLESQERRMNDESELTLARNDPLYQASPRDDGMFHCPFEGSQDCNHKPAPLKCNYDKFVDSHLRPYRCKVKACASLQFSSTACLLRHEREAHGMHGHGAKPFTCPYQDCERSAEGCGFPRRWNLLDHMRRVHEYKGDTSSRSSFSSAASHHTDHRKRKLIKAQQKQESKKQKASSGHNSTAGSKSAARKQAASQRAQQLQNLTAEQEVFQSTLQEYFRALQASQKTLHVDRLEAQREGLSHVIDNLRQLQGELDPARVPQMPRGGNQDPDEPNEQQSF